MNGRMRRDLMVKMFDERNRIDFARKELASFLEEACGVLCNLDGDIFILEGGVCVPYSIHDLLALLEWTCVFAQKSVNVVDIQMALSYFPLYDIKAGASEEEVREIIVKKENYFDRVYGDGSWDMGEQYEL